MTTLRSSAFFHHVDVSNFEIQVDFFKEALKQVPTGRIDYVFPNAGIAESTYLADPDPGTAEGGLPKLETFVKPDLLTIDVNLNGVLYTTSLATQLFRTQPLVDGFRGKIVITTSITWVDSTRSQEMKLTPYTKVACR